MSDNEKELVIRVIAMPSDTNPGGDMFGGWIVSQMDLAAWVYARKLTKQRIVTIAIDNLKFTKPIFVGDCVICYASLVRTGNTSITVQVEVVVERRENHQREQVTEGRFTFVAIGEDRKPVPFERKVV
mgnify:CR=1 FL=1